MVPRKTKCTNKRRMRRTPFCFIFHLHSAQRKLYTHTERAPLLSPNTVFFWKFRQPVPEREILFSRLGSLCEQEGNVFRFNLKCIRSRAAPTRVTRPRGSGVFILLARRLPAFLLSSLRECACAGKRNRWFGGEASCEKVFLIPRRLVIGPAAPFDWQLAN